MKEERNRELDGSNSQFMAAVDSHVVWSHRICVKTDASAAIACVGDAFWRAFQGTTSVRAGDPLTQCEVCGFTWVLTAYAGSLCREYTCISI